MKCGKHKQISPKCKKAKRIALPLILALLILSVGVGGTLAYIIAKTQDLTNSFVPGEVSCQVIQSDGKISVKNTGNVKAYIRAVVIVNWMDSEGNVSGTAPTYTATLNDGWIYDSATGIYYYNDKVTPDGIIPVPVSISGESANPDSSAYSFQIEVVAEAIQAEGMGTDVDSAQKAWAKAHGQKENTSS